MTSRRLVVVCTLAALISGCGSQGSTPAPTASTYAGSSPPCGQVPPGSVSYSHVIWLWMENQSYEQVVGSNSAPYLNSLARACGLATNYHNITHPSLPNYIAATSGLSGQALQPFRSDC